MIFLPLLLSFIISLMMLFCQTTISQAVSNSNLCLYQFEQKNSLCSGVCMCSLKQSHFILSFRILFRYTFKYPRPLKDYVALKSMFLSLHCTHCQMSGIHVLFHCATCSLTAYTSCHWLKDTSFSSISRVTLVPHLLATHISSVL